MWGTGNPSENFDSARNSHTLKSTRIFINSSTTPQAFRPSGLNNRLLRTTHNLRTCIGGKLHQIVKIEVFLGIPFNPASDRVEPDRGINTTLSPETQKTHTSSLTQYFQAVVGTVSSMMLDDMDCGKTQRV